MSAALTCAQCGAAVGDGDAFCEACGMSLGEGDQAGLPEAASDPSIVSPTEPLIDPDPATSNTAPRCRSCGGEVDEGYCTVCGVRAPTGRDHWSESPAPWLGGVCDKGVVHARNEDAMALAATADGSLGVLVVCDGVTTAPDSDRASLAAARAACRELSGTPLPSGTADAALIAAWDQALRRAARAANAEAVGIARSLGDPPEPPSCTFVAAVVHAGMVHAAWCGDSRAYWLADDGPALQLSVDHSLGTELVRGGMSQAEAEADARFHTITRWLGADSADPTPDVGAQRLDGPGWVAVVSDGLWNYASAPAAIAAALGRALDQLGADAAPTAVAQHMVDFANEQGGHDNVTVALARLNPSVT